MMLQHGVSITVLLLSAWLAATGLQQGYGWLDRVVQFQKDRLINEVKALAPININVELRRKPEGYEDSRHWDANSVLRLLTLIRESETAKPVHKALRRMLWPTRRIMMSMKESMQMFPSLKKDNNFYYDVEYTSAEDNVLPPDPALPEDQAVIVVSNPVEARLPSARISVKLLREILIARARAARQMPTTTAIIPWIEFLKNRTLEKNKATCKSTAAAGDNQPTTNPAKPETTNADVDDESTTVGGDTSTATGDAGAETQPEGETTAEGDETTPDSEAETTPEG